MAYHTINKYSKLMKNIKQNKTKQNKTKKKRKQLEVTKQMNKNNEIKLNQ